MQALSLEEQKSILALHIAPASGRHRQLLNLLLAAYPHSLSEQQLKHKLSMTGEFSFYSALRNARIFLEVNEFEDIKSEAKHYVIDDWPVRMVKLRRVMGGR
ncbi:hypothetical protein ACPV5S_19515 [Vibrio astriarenae]